MAEAALKTAPETEEEMTDGFNLIIDALNALTPGCVWSAP